MFQLSAIRDLNQVALFYNDKKDTSGLVFKAYLKQGYNFRLGVKVGDAFSSISGLAANAVVASVVQQALQYLGRNEVAALSVPRKITFLGGEWIPFDVQCTLYVINDFKQDVLIPIHNLEALILPKESKTFNTDTIFDAVLNKTEQIKQNAIAKESKTNPKYSGGIWELAQKGVSALKAYAGNIALLEAPKQFSDNTKSLTIKMPGLVIPEVYLKSVTFNVPYVNYGDKDGKPFIDRVDLNLSFETMRIASQDYFKFLG